MIAAYCICILVIGLVAVWFFIEEPIYTAKKNAVIAEKYKADSCDSSSKFCLFQNSTLLCEYQTTEDIEFFGNCHVRGDKLYAR